MATRFGLNFEAVLSTTLTALAGGSIAFYSPGTTTLKTIYADNGLTTPKTNPVILDSAGKHGDIFLSAADYRVVVKDSAGATVPGGDIDPVHGGIDLAITAFDSFPLATGYTFGTVLGLGTATALPANTYNNGAAGVGATLTATANGALTVDGQAVTATRNVLVKNEADATHNGLYTCTQAGDAGTPYILTRATFWNTTAQAITGIYGLSESGNTQGNTRWLFVNPGITFGTTSINFSQWTKGQIQYLDAGGALAMAGFAWAGNSKPSLTGGWLVAGPNSDWGLTVDGYVGSNGQSYGLRIDAGTGALDRVFSVLTNNESSLGFEIRGDNSWTAIGPLQNQFLVSYAPSVGTSMAQLKSTTNAQGAHLRFTATTGAEMSLGTSSTGDNLLIRYAAHGNDPAGGTTIATWTQAGGLQVGATPTGGDKGAGTINVSGNVYQNGTAYTNPDYVLEHWATGKIEKYADKAGAKDYRPKSLAQFRAYAKRYLHLPGLGQHSGVGLFDGGDAVLANLESAFIYIFELEERLKALTSRLAKAGL